MADINFEWKEFKEYEKSDTYQNVLSATNLLSDKWTIDSDQLKTTMQRNYDLNDSEYNDVLKHMANSKYVDMRQGTFDHKIKLKLKS